MSRQAPTSKSPAPAAKKESSGTKKTSSFTSQNAASNTVKTNSQASKSERDTASPKYPQIRIVENFIVVWLDANINESTEEFTKTKSYIQRLVYKIVPFNDPNACRNYLNSITEEKIFLIVSGSLGQSIVEYVQHMIQVESIYIYCNNRSIHEQWAKNVKKVQGVFTEIEPIYDALRRDVRQLDNDFIPITILTLPSDIDSNELDQSFVYSRLLRQLILESDNTIQTMKDLVEFCQVQYSDNQNQLNIIKEFAEKYRENSPLWWYTRGCFIYSMVNRALRTQDTEILKKMEFIIRDLHHDIQHVYSQSDSQPPMTIYRGQCMSNEKFEKLKKTKSGLISFNSFLSTSIYQEHASVFIEKARIEPDVTGVLFRMKIDPSNALIPFVKLKDLSYNTDWHDEILFSMSTIFQIVDIKEFDHRLWNVDLILANNNDKQMRLLMKYMQKKSRESKGWDGLAHLTSERDDSYTAENDCQISTETTSDTDFEQKVNLCYQRGHSYSEEKDYTNALQQYHECLRIIKNHLPPNHPSLYAIYFDMGTIFKNQDDFNNALDYFQRAMYIQRENVPTSDPSLAVCYNNIGAIHLAKKDYQMAFVYYQEVLAIQQKSLSPSSLELAATHGYLSSIYSNTGRPSEALEHASEALKIARQVLGPEDSRIRIYEEHLDKLRRNDKKRNPKK